MRSKVGRFHLSGFWLISRVGRKLIRRTQSGLPVHGGVKTEKVGHSRSTNQEALFRKFRPPTPHLSHRKETIFFSNKKDDPNSNPNYTCLINFTNCPISFSDPFETFRTFTSEKQTIFELFNEFDFQSFDLKILIIKTFSRDFNRDI